jgi:hypothetical protein
MLRHLVFAATVALAAALSVTVGLGAQQPHNHGVPAAAGAARRVAPMKAHSGPLPALPRVNFQPPRPMPVVQQVYEFAALHPEVLQYVPCYCGCERVGHNGNHDCFVKSRAANGRVAEWDAHGIGCTICIDVANDARLMFNAGQKPDAIRAAIEKKYGSHFPSSTPTPKPPRS